MGPKLRYGLLAGTFALAAVAFVGLVGNMALSGSGKAARDGQRSALELVLLAVGAAALVLLLGRPLRVTRAQAGPESLIR